jgi:glycosyltransferase involved in cell wall biosynthesis
MRSDGSGEGSMMYVTGFDPLSYRRPLLARKALPGLEVFYVKSLRRLGLIGNILFRFFLKTGKIEGMLCKRSRSGGDYYISALLRDFLESFEFKGLRRDAVIALNPYLASRVIWGDDATVILDWMDVWMTPEGDLHPFDVITAKRADGVIFWSKPMLEFITKRLNLRRYVYVPYGIDSSIFNPRKYGNRKYFREKFGIKDKFMLLYSGGIWRVDNVDLQGTDKMLKAFALASRKLGNVILVLQVARLDTFTLELIKRMRIKVKIIGAQPYASFLRQSAFAAADVLLAPGSEHPTAYYAEKMKFFQYMVTGKAIIAERTPGALSALGDAALYVELGDIEGMANAIVELLCNSELREELGARASERARLFEWEKLMPVYRDFVLKIVSP